MSRTKALTTKRDARAGDPLVAAITLATAAEKHARDAVITLQRIMADAEDRDQPITLDHLDDLERQLRATFAAVATTNEELCGMLPLTSIKEEAAQ